MSGSGPTPAAMAPGLYGKLPSHGDFLREGLPGWFVSSWDGWLQRNMLAAAAHFGDAWDDVYAAAPCWKFALPQGSLHPDWCVVGVLIPSHDKVGRLFPCTVAVILPGDAAAAFTGLALWLDNTAQALGQAVAGNGLAIPPLDEMAALEPTSNAGHSLWQAMGQATVLAAPPLPPSDFFQTLFAPAPATPELETCEDIC